MTGDQARTFDVVYAGVALAGCQTSLSQIAKACDPEPTTEQLRSSPCDVHWSYPTGTFHLRLMQEYYSNLLVPRLIDALHEQPPDRIAKQNAYDGITHWNGLVPGWRALVAFLETVGGAVFVVDSQRERIEAGIERLEHFTSNLRDCGRLPSEIAIVFQLNKRDCPSAVDVSVLRETFRWPGPSAFVESVATTGRGVREALDALLSLADHADFDGP